MQNYKCLECYNEYTISFPEWVEDAIEDVAFCPFCGEAYIIKTSETEYE
jgi:hypothetical protein